MINSELLEVSAITQAHIRSLFHYNPETGVFTNIKRTSSRSMIGYISGCLNSAGYRRIRIKGKQYQAHRLVFLYLYGKMPLNQVDHINHIRSDNRLCNLREVTSQENLRNISLSRNNTSGVTGVVWCSRDSRWQSQIKFNRKYIYLGYFVDKFEAICARKSAENKYGFHENHGKPTINSFTSCEIREQ